MKKAKTLSELKRENKQLRASNERLTKENAHLKSLVEESVIERDASHEHLIQLEDSIIAIDVYKRRA